MHTFASFQMQVREAQSQGGRVPGVRLRVARA